MGDLPDARTAGPGQAHGVSAERLVLQLTIEPGDALAGSLAPEDGGTAMAFSGWFGLVETLEVLMRRTDQVGGPASLDEQSGAAPAPGPSTPEA